MAGDLKIKIDTSELNEFVRLDCENISCRFINLFQRNCELKRVYIGKNGACASFEEASKELSEAFHKRLEGVT